jgi:Protein of unknown function (DUF3606).
MDNKRKRGKQDRIRVARNEDYEVRYVARKFRLNIALVRAVIARGRQFAWKSLCGVAQTSRATKAAGAKKKKAVMPVRYGISLSGLRLADAMHALTAHLQISDIGPKPNTSMHISAYPPNVRFTPERRHSLVRMECPLWAKSGHWREDRWNAATKRCRYVAVSFP